MRRFQKHFESNPGANGLPGTHPAIAQSRTLFPGTVTNPADSPRLLISGLNHRKIGKQVTKGRWRGMPIFCLTLQERATCPNTCHHWRDCYGNSMHWARRHQHGAALEYLLVQELDALAHSNPSGFIVRLHVLGDFYDEPYVLLWRRWLNQYPPLRIFGYTAHPETSLIGRLIDTLNADFGDRVYIRFSRKWPSVRVISAITIPDTSHPTDAIICPAQTGKTACCGTCGLCWSTDKTIAFLQHGRTFKTVDADA